MSPSQPSADKVKEVTAFSKECLEKIERCRTEKDYHQVHTSFPSLLLPPTVSASPSSVCPLSGGQVVSRVSGETAERLGRHSPV